METNDEVGILEQVEVMKREMPLPHVNLLHAEAWLWEESKAHIKKKTEKDDSRDSLSQYRCLEHRRDISPGDSDQAEMSSKSSIIEAEAGVTQGTLAVTRLVTMKFG